MTSKKPTPQNTMAGTAGTGLPSVAAVSAFLNANPDFFVKHPDLLAAMTAPGAPRDGNVLDLQHFKLQRAQAESHELQASQQYLIDTARANQTINTQVHMAALAIMNADSFEAMIQTVTIDWAVFLDIDAVTLCIENSEIEVPPTYAANVRRVPTGLVDQQMGENLDIRIDENIIGDEQIFGAAAPMVRSQALVRLKISAATPVGLLGLGSRKEDGFQVSQGTETLAFLVQVLEAMVRRWLYLPV
jgi:uncharacterized protein YigA (DUF484 family)